MACAMALTAVIKEKLFQLPDKAMWLLRAGRLNIREAFTFVIKGKLLREALQKVP
jgi:hypothetical protein